MPSCLWHLYKCQWPNLLATLPIGEGTVSGHRLVELCRQLHHFVYYNIGLCYLHGTQNGAMHDVWKARDSPYRAAALFYSSLYIRTSVAGKEDRQVRRGIQSCFSNLQLKLVQHCLPCTNLQLNVNTLSLSLIRHTLYFTWTTL